MFERAIGNQPFYKLSKYIHAWTYTDTKMQTHTHIYIYIKHTHITVIQSTENKCLFNTWPQMYHLYHTVHDSMRSTICSCWVIKIDVKNWGVVWWVWVKQREELGLYIVYMYKILKRNKILYFNNNLFKT